MGKLDPPVTPHTPQTPRRTIVVGGDAPSKSEQPQRELPHRDLQAAHAQWSQVAAGRPQTPRPLRLSPDIADRADFRERVLAIAATRGVVPRNRLEEAFVFQWMGVGQEYLMFHPLRRRDVLEAFEQQGGSLFQVMFKMRRLVMDSHAVAIPDHVTLVFRVHANGNITDIALFETQMTPNSHWTDAAPFQWGPELKRYRPIDYNLRSRDLVHAWFTGIGLPLEHVVERVFVRTIMGARGGRGQERSTLTDLDDYFSKRGIGGIVLWVSIAGRLDDRFISATRLRLTLHINEGYNDFSGIEIMPLGPGEEWVPLPRTATFLLEKADGEWHLRRHQGDATERLAVHLKPKDKVVPVVGPRANVELSWAELRIIMRNPQRRRELIDITWRRCHPETPIPKVFVFQASKDGKDEARQALNLDILDAAQLPEKSHDLAWLTFKKETLVWAKGRAAQDLVEDVLRGNGILLEDPLEYVLGLRPIMSGVVTSQDGQPLTDQKVLGYFEAHGRLAVPQLLDLLHRINPQRPRRPHRFALSGARPTPSHVVSGIRVWYEKDAHDDNVDGQHFWVQWEQVSEDHYVETQANLRFGKQIAEAAKGEGRVQAPDATEKEATAAAVAKATRPGGFATVDPISPPEPTRTPVELKTVKPLIHVPVAVKEGKRGFEPASPAWKDLALQPFTHPPSQFERILIWAASLAMGAWFLRSPRITPLRGGAVFVSDPERI